MKDQKQKMVNFLLLHANPSIKLRVRKEVLNDISESEEKEWKLQISNERTIRFIAEKQQPNGWIGLGFHGGNKNAGQFDNQEVGVKMCIRDRNLAGRRYGIIATAGKVSKETIWAALWN